MRGAPARDAACAQKRAYAEPAYEILLSRATRHVDLPGFHLTARSGLDMTTAG